MVSLSMGNFEDHFNFGSFLPLFIFIIGIYINYLFVTSEFSQGVFVMMLVFVIYVTNNIIINITKSSSIFNEYLEDIGSFTAFGLSTVIFGLIFFRENYIILSIIIFYSVTLILSLARNWILRLKNSLGWPIALNGVFFPLIYYIYLFYLGTQADSIFIIFFILIGILLVSTYNFVGYDETLTNISEKRKDNGKTDESIKNEENNNSNEDIENSKNDEKEKKFVNEEESKNDSLQSNQTLDLEKIDDIINSLKEKNNKH